MISTELYESMLQAKQAGDCEAAESLMIAIEKLRTNKNDEMDSMFFESLLPSLPEFAKMVLGKTQKELGKSERSNCINAAFNFHDSTIGWETYSTMDFLNRIQNDFVQLDSIADFKWGDLVVLWTRMGGSWDNRLINVHEMDIESPDFPYGLIFDHVAVRLSQELVFHKPDPTPESRYQIESLKSAISVASGQKGFEMTFHRKV